MAIILDVNAAMEILRRRKKGLLFFNAVINANEVLAPSVYKEELANTLWKEIVFGKEILKDGKNAFEEGIEFIEKYVDCDSLFDSALEIAVKEKHSIYDCLYIALAKREKATLLTLDKKMLKLSKKYSIETLQQGKGELNEKCI